MASRPGNVPRHVRSVRLPHVTPPGWLALVGGSPWQEGCTFDADLLAASGGSEVLVLPTAAAFEHPDRLVARAAEWFAPVGGAVVSCPILNRRDAEDPALVAMIRRARFIYIAGDSPMHLLGVLKDTQAWVAVEAAWRSGAVLAAASDAAMVLGDPMVDPRGGAFTIGLGLISDLAVLPHADTWPPARTKRTLKIAGKRVTVALIDERTALLRNPSGSWSSAGVGSVVLHENGADVEIRHLDARPV